ncbi:hypothetical protein ACTG16_22710 [Aeromonas sp. 23P]|uniref:hypothetical protein n=1 Tax=Aeromonas sp. 23P TaxID=3452716 RepID=UPI003F79A40D
MTEVDVFIQHMLGKPNSELVVEAGGVTCIEIAHFDHGQPQGKYPISTSRFTVYADGRVLSTTRDDVEGTEFRERSRYHLRNVTIEQSKIHIHQQGW